MDDGPKELLKCVLCGVNIKTPLFERVWNEEAINRGHADLYDIFEEKKDEYIEKHTSLIPELMWSDTDIELDPYVSK